MKNQSYLRFFCILFLGLFMAACGKNEIETITTSHQGYFPLRIGKTLVYDVDTVFYHELTTNNVKIDTVRWQVQEVFVDTFKDITGLLNYRIERSERPRDRTEPFVVKKIFTAALSDNGALRTEDNLKFIKMPYFVSEKTIWDGNIYCDQSLIIEVKTQRMGLFSKKWDYEVMSLGKAEKIGFKDFTNVLTIRAQSDPKILTEKR